MRFSLFQLLFLIFCSDIFHEKPLLQEMIKLLRVNLCYLDTYYRLLSLPNIKDSGTEVFKELFCCSGV